MIKKALLLLIVTSFAVTAQTKDFVIEAWKNKTPAFIMASFGKKLNFNEVNSLGLDRWTFETDEVGKEELATYRMNLVGKGYKIKGRDVFAFEANFYRPLGSKIPFKCWDAFYVICADYNKKPICP